MTDLTNIHLARLIHWRWLIEQMALPPKERAATIQPTINGAYLNMNVITEGRAEQDIDGAVRHFCLSACCALGAATLYPAFQAQGLKPAISLSGSLSANSLTLDGTVRYYDDIMLARWFGLTLAGYLSITNPSEYRDMDDDGGPMEKESSIEPSEVIERIDDAIAATFGRDAVYLTPADVTLPQGATP